MGPTEQPPRSEFAADQPQIKQSVVGLALLVLMVVIIMWTSTPPTLVPEDPLIEVGGTPDAPPQSPAIEDSADGPDPATSQPEPTTVIDGLQIHTRINSLADPQPGWLVIAGQSRVGQPSTATARCQHDNELEIDTVNVNRFELDLSALPVAVSRRLIMHIDGQDMLLFAKTGAPVTFARSPEGAWSYDKP